MNNSDGSGKGINRRSFLKAAGIVGGVVLAKGAFAAGPSFKEGMLSEKLLAGAIDMHVHADPDVRPRAINDIDLCRRAKEVGMRAMVLKNHDFITNDRAYLVRQVVPGIEIFGGIALNESVGGINPVAVETMLQFTGACARYVWLPTYQSSFEMSLKKGHHTGTGVKVLDSAGKVLPDVRKVMKIVAKADLILGTGHISPAESLVIVKAAKEEGIGKIVVTHAMQSPFEMTLDDMKRAADMGAYIEHCYLSFLMGPMAPMAAYRTGRKQVSMEAFAKAINTVGAERCFISTDLGQAMNPTPADGMRDFITQLTKLGITKEQIDFMARKNPAKLLGLEG
jgi:hypothetical protein